MAQARLNAVVLDDGGLPCEGRFQYGTTPAMGTFTPWQGGLLTGNTFSALITGLLGGTQYYFRAEIRMATGSGYSGAILAFMTVTPLVPTVDILAPTGITEYRATLHGIVTFQGDRQGSVRFQYGTSRNYGAVTPWQDGFGTGSTFDADISGLSPGAAYHVRAEFFNRTGPPVYSGDITFSTLSEVGSMALLGDDTIKRLGGGV